MISLLTGIKASSKKTFLVTDEGNLVKIKQPDIYECCPLVLYSVIKINKYY